jgi:hypothetical protein
MWCCRERGRAALPCLREMSASEALPGEGCARGTTLTLVAARLDLGPLFAAQAREERERCTGVMQL